MILYAPFARRMPHLKGPSPKDYPYALELAQRIEAEANLIQVGSSEDEVVTQNFKMGLSFDGLCKLIDECGTAVCVDSYLQHCMWLKEKKAIVLWGVSDPLIFGHDLHINLLKDRSYLRPRQYDLYYDTEVNPDAFVNPAVVMEELAKFVPAVVT